jgi:uncharacterized protein (TIGR02145 family)
MRTERFFVFALCAMFVFSCTTVETPELPLPYGNSSNSAGGKGDKGDPGEDGEDGKDGDGCDVESDGAYFVMECGGVEKARWAKAMCETIAYDPEELICKNGVLYSVLGFFFIDSRDGQKYRFAEIGEQTWMAENLNFAVEGSKCYENKPENCEKYGRLYNWETALKACPSGWHIPSNDEWDKLFRYVDGTSDTSSLYDSPVAGKHLKAASGWNSEGSGTDDYGFSALPGGNYLVNGFGRAGEYGNWWSADEYDSSFAYYRYIHYSNERARWDYNGKSYLFSVRCIQD